MSQYILDGHRPKRCLDIVEWGRWMQTADRHVGKTEINGVTISTVFLALDHNFDGGPPILFETMVFGGAMDQEQDRYCSWEEAEEGHKAMVERVRQSEQLTPYTRHLLRDLLQSLTFGAGLAAALTHVFFDLTWQSWLTATALLTAVCFIAMRPWAGDRGENSTSQDRDRLL